MAERRLFLTSSGIHEETLPYLRRLLNESIRNTIVGVVIVPGSNYKEQVQARSTIQHLKDIGFTAQRIMDLSDLNFSSLNGPLKRIDMLYVNSSNTFELMHLIRKSGLGRHLRNNYSHIVYCGASAGSLVAGPSIEIAGWKPYQDKNRVGMKDFNGINIVDFAVAPHFRPGGEDLLAQQYQRVKYPVVAISDTQAIVVNGRFYTVVGCGESRIFNEQVRPIKPKQVPVIRYGAI